jgi:hypothetical protein
MIFVREASRFSRCQVLGELISQSTTRIGYRRRPDAPVAFAQRSPLVHIEPCRACADYQHD